MRLWTGAPSPFSLLLLPNTGALQTLAHHTAVPARPASSPRTGFIPVTTRVYPFSSPKSTPLPVTYGTLETHQQFSDWRAGQTSSSQHCSRVDVPSEAGALAAPQQNPCKACGALHPSHQPFFLFNPHSQHFEDEETGAQKPRETQKGDIPLTLSDEEGHRLHTEKVPLPGGHTLKALPGGWALGPLPPSPQRWRPQSYGPARLGGAQGTPC